MLDFDILAETVCKKINGNTTIMLPSLSMEVGKINGLRDKIKLLTKRVDQVQFGTKEDNKDQELKDMKFMINRALAEVETVNKVFANNRIEQIEAEVKKIKMMEFELDTMKIKTNNKAAKDDVEKVKDSITKMVPLKNFEDLANDVRLLSEDIVKHSELNVVIEEHRFM